MPKTWRKMARRFASLSSAMETPRNAASTPCAVVGSDDVDLGLGEAVADVAGKFDRFVESDRSRLAAV